MTSVYLFVNQTQPNFVQGLSVQSPEGRSLVSDNVSKVTKKKLLKFNFCWENKVLDEYVWEMYWIQMRLVHLSPSATNTQENEMFNLKKIVCDQNGDFFERGQNADNYTTRVCFKILVPTILLNHYMCTNQWPQKMFYCCVWKEFLHFFKLCSFKDCYL